MKTLTIRRVPDDLHREIRVTAAGKGLSMEEEARQRLAHRTEGATPQRPAYDPERAAAARERLWKMFEGLEHRSFVDEFLAEKRERARRELSE
jgi:plasmid stability protein